MRLKHKILQNKCPYLNIAVDCGNPSMNMSYLERQFTSGSPPASTAYLSSVVIECFSGYRWADSSSNKTMTCAANGIWSAIPTCYPESYFGIQCGDPSENMSILNQLYSYGSPPSAFTFLETASLKCLYGFRWTDSLYPLIRVITCLETAIWNPVPACIRIDSFISIYLFVIY